MAKGASKKFGFSGGGKSTAPGIKPIAGKPFGISGGGGIPRGKKVTGPGQQLKQVVGGKGLAKF